MNGCKLLLEETGEKEQAGTGKVHEWLDYTPEVVLGALRTLGYSVRENDRYAKDGRYVRLAFFWSCVKPLPDESRVHAIVVRYKNCCWVTVHHDLAASGRRHIPGPYGDPCPQRELDDVKREIRNELNPARR